MIRLLLVTSALLLGACQPQAGPRGDDGPVLVTVLSPSGSAAAPQSGLFERYALAGPADGFTLERLKQLEPATLSAAYPAGTAPRAWTGPALSDVLAAAGAPGAGARLTALDGYAIEIGAARIAEHAPILALSADGAPLSLGGLGPVMLIWPDTAPGPDTDSGAADWVWGVFAIEALGEGADQGAP